MAKIGIGVTSYNRPDHLKLWRTQVIKHTPVQREGIIIHEALNIPNIAKAKNECLKALKDCDHIFLLDDDCFPIADGWIEYFINNPFGAEHLLYLTDRHGLPDWCKRVSKMAAEGLNVFHECGGCFIYLTKKVFETVGYFNSEYKQYGFEHAGYSNRIYKAGFTNMPYQSLMNTKNYIYSLDYQGTDRFLIDHKPSITDFEAMQESIDYNRKVFEKEINSDKIYYDYE